MYRISAVFASILAIIAGVFAFGPNENIGVDFSASEITKGFTDFLDTATARGTTNILSSRVSGGGTGVIHTGTTLTGSTLSGVTLSRVTLSGSTLSGSIQWNALSGALHPPVTKGLRVQTSGPVITCFRTDIAYNMMSDNSYLRYVSPDCSLVNTGYVPSDLVRLRSSDSLVIRWKEVLLRKEASDALYRLAKDFRKAMKTPIKVVSGYRSFNYQNGMRARGCDVNFCAKAGHSEHQLGLAIDIFEATSNKEFLNNAGNRKRHDWMVAHAAEYGFTESYQYGKEIDGYEKEPWHWRYVGVEFAKELASKQLSFGKFMKSGE